MSGSQEFKNTSTKLQYTPLGQERSSHLHPNAYGWILLFFFPQVMLHLMPRMDGGLEINQGTFS